MRAGRCTYLLSAMLCLLARPAAAAAGSPAKVVVVAPPSAASDKVFAAQIRALEQPVAAACSLVPLADYERAGRTLGIKPLALYGDESAVTVGRLVGASHVFVVRPRSAVGKRRGPPTFSAVLVDTDTGAGLIDVVYPLSRSAAQQGKVAAELSAMMAAALGPSAAVALAPPAAESAEAAAPPVAVPTPAAPLVAKVAPEAARKSAAPAAAAPPAVVAVPAEEELPPPAAPPRKVSNEPALVAPPPKAAVAHAPPPAAPSASPSFWDAEARLPRGVVLAAGALVYGRTAALIAGGQTDLRYGAENGARAPIFARAVVDLEAYPGRWHRGPLGPLGGILLFGHFEGGQSKTRALSGNVVSLRSTAWRLGLGYRSPLWRGPRAMAASLRVGFAQYLFGSNAEVPFVAVGLRGLALGLGLELPLATRHVALVGQGGLMLAPKAFGGLQQLGQSQANALGGNLDAGLRFSMGPIDLSVLFDWARYSARFFGQSELAAALNGPFRNAQLVDQNIGGKLMLGLQL